MVIRQPSKQDVRFFFSIASKSSFSLMSNIQPTHTHQQWQNQGRKLCHHANKIYVSLRLTIRLVRQYFTSKTSALSFWCPNVLNGCTKRVCYAWIIESSISARAVVLAAVVAVPMWKFWAVYWYCGRPMFGKIFLNFGVARLSPQQSCGHQGWMVVWTRSTFPYTQYQRCFLFSLDDRHLSDHHSHIIIIIILFLPLANIHVVNCRDWYKCLPINMPEYNQKLDTILNYQNWYTEVHTYPLWFAVYILDKFEQQLKWSVLQVEKSMIRGSTWLKCKLSSC